MPAPDTTPQAARSLACDVNALRAQRGLPALRWDWRLASAARWMAGDMAAHHYISHETPDGKTIADRVGRTGYIRDNYNWILEENLGWGRGDYSSPAAMSTGWMNSEGHRLNIMAADIHDIGIGVAEGWVSEDYGDGFFYVAEFGSRGKPRTARRAHRSR
jgi:uncharacterized protein YkwD